MPLVKILIFGLEIQGCPFPGSLNGHKTILTQELKKHAAFRLDAHKTVLSRGYVDLFFSDTSWCLRKIAHPPEGLFQNSGVDIAVIGQSLLAGIIQMFGIGIYPATRKQFDFIFSFIVHMFFSILSAVWANTGNTAVFVKNITLLKNRPILL